MELKNGDRVRGTYGCTSYFGTVYHVSADTDSASIARDDGVGGCGVGIPAGENGGRIPGSRGWLVRRRKDSLNSFGGSEGEGTLLLISTNTNKFKDMNLKEKFAIAITPEPYKSMRKVGIINGDNVLTDDGSKIFLSWILKKHAEEFKTDVVDGLVNDVLK